MVHKVLFYCALLSPLGSLLAQTSAGSAVSVMAETLYATEDFFDLHHSEAAHAALAGQKALVARVPAKLANQVIRWHQTEGAKGWLRGWYSNGQMALEAAFHRNQLHGHWRSFHENGRLHDEGMLKHNLPHGVWKTWYSSGTLQSVRHFDAHKYEATQVAIARRNPKLAFSPLAIQGIKHPETWRQAQSPAATYENLQVQQGYQPPFTQSLSHGVAVTYYANGKQHESGHYKDGLKDGQWQWWAENGALVSMGYYLHGQRHGAWKQFNAAGKMVKLFEYKQGVLVHSKAY